MPPLVLLVEPNATTSVVLKRLLAPMADVVASSSFQQARVVLRERPPDLLVTALRLGAYNGLHLVYLAAAFEPATRCIVHVAAVDAGLVPDIHRAGAFCEPAARFKWALPSYLSATLPSRDRRETVQRDRRLVLRGGRRATDTGSCWLPAPQPSAQIRKEPAMVTRRVREVLLVDDDPSFVETFGSCLSHDGYTVVAELTLPGALQYLTSHTPDAVITDIHLGPHNGWELAKHIKLRQPTLPVIVITGWADQMEAEVEYWRVPVFLKPFDSDDVLAYLGSTLSDD
jgi:DNA-binding NtrC family response regulator